MSSCASCIRRHPTGSASACGTRTRSCSSSGWASVSIVLPGDIGREGERAILPRLEPGRLVVLKAPHHGSATSSTAELLDALRPAAVIFSAAATTASATRTRPSSNATGRSGRRCSRPRRTGRCSWRRMGEREVEGEWREHHSGRRAHVRRRQPPIAVTRLTATLRTSRGARRHDGATKVWLAVFRAGLGCCSVVSPLTRIGRTARHGGDGLRLSGAPRARTGFREKHLREAFCLELNARGLSVRVRESNRGLLQELDDSRATSRLAGRRNRACRDQGSAEAHRRFTNGRCVSYLKTMDLRVGLLINFNSTLLTNTA